LLEVGGKPLIQHQLDVLRSLGIERVYAIVGHQAHKVCAYCDDGCNCIPNTRYAETNSLYSLYLAANHVRGAFMLLNSDVLAHPEVYRRVAAAEGACLAYDSNSGDEDEHMKVSFVNGRLKAIAKDMSPDRVCGENVGILKYDAPTAKMLFAEAASIVEGGNERCWSPAALNNIAERTSIRGVDVAGLPWTEIDFPEDLERARNDVWNAIRTNTFAPQAEAELNGARQYFPASAVWKRA